MHFHEIWEVGILYGPDKNLLNFGSDSVAFVCSLVVD